MRSGDIVVRVRGQRFDQMDAERVAAFLKALTELFGATRLVRLRGSIIVLRRRDAETPETREHANG